MKRELLIISIIIILLGCVNQQEELKQEPEKMTAAKLKLLIVPIGEIEQQVLEEIGQSVHAEMGLSYEIAQSMPVDEQAYHHKRGQYLSTFFLGKLVSEYSAPGVTVLGVINQDLYVPGLNFVFGEADMINRAAVISIIRLREEFYGKRPDAELFRRRALTEAVHELGHTFGLGHCSDPHCVMFFSNSLADTDRKGYKFCTRCQLRLPPRRTPIP